MDTSFILKLTCSIVFFYESGVGWGGGVGGSLTKISWHAKRFFKITKILIRISLLNSLFHFRFLHARKKVCVWWGGVYVNFKKNVCFEKKILTFRATCLRDLVMVKLNPLTSTQIPTNSFSLCSTKYDLKRSKMHVCKLDGGRIEQLFMLCLWRGLEKKCAQELHAIKLKLFPADHTVLQL